MNSRLSGTQLKAERPDDSLRAEVLRVVGSFFAVLVVAETVLCLTLGLPNPLTVFASAFQ